MKQFEAGRKADVCRCVDVFTGASSLTSVSRDAAAVLRWSGMSSWVCEWIPAGWSCHSGWRRKYDPIRPLQMLILED